MLKSLYSGVAGLQAHQIAMDIESNNIANVNTVGFKYSRANFSDMLAQTKLIATAPQGDLGGKNAVQVGLGASVNSVTRIHSQGSIQSTDKNTDVAIQGDGYFVVSADGGRTTKYTRAGDFKFDATGNFVDNNGFVVQGWMRDEVTKKVDSTTPIESIKIAPGLTTPAKATETIVLKANLNSGTTVENFSPINALDQFDDGYDLNHDGTLDSKDDLTGDGVYDQQDSNSENTNNLGRIFLDANNRRQDLSEDFGVLFDGNGHAFSLQPAVKDAAGNGNGGQGATISFDGNLRDSNGNDTGKGKEYRYTQDPNLENTTQAGAGKNGRDIFYFTTTEDLRNQLQKDADNVSKGATVEVTSDGKISVSNKNGDKSLVIDVGDVTDGVTTANDRFTRTMQGMSGTLPAGSNGVRQTQGITAATHSASIDVFDSLGTKHTVKIDFKKESVNPTTGSSWKVMVSVPEPGVINSSVSNPPLPGEKPNMLEGQVTFTSDGALSSFIPSSITYTANNGSKADQTISLDTGTTFDGVTSYDARSTTSGISQDGYTGGDLLGIRIDQSGTLIGSFTNGRSFGLAQIAMAKFANNEGLTADGGNIFLQTANSGEAVIGAAAGGGRGFIQSSSLESSNADLSRSLTQLIIIQRGYQANGKTITTSDQLLQALLGLKQ